MPYCRDPGLWVSRKHYHGGCRRRWRATVYSKMNVYTLYIYILKKKEENRAILSYTKSPKLAWRVLYLFASYL